MNKKRFIAAAVLVGMLAGVLPLSGQEHTLHCFIADPDVQGKTNIRATPGGKVIFQVDAADFYQLEVIVKEGSWWKIKDPRLESFGELVEIPSKEAWIHRSVLALGTDNSDGHSRVLRKEPRADAPRAGLIREFNALVRPLELSKDGKWVKVKYEEDNLTGWIEVSWMRDDAFEPGDGFAFPTLPAYACPLTDIPLYAAPNGEKIFSLKKGKTYDVTVMSPRDGWWEVLGERVFYGEDFVDLPDVCWVSASDLLVMTNPSKQGKVPVYTKADEKAPLAGQLARGVEVHPLDVTGEWPIWVRICTDGKDGLTGWVNYSDLYFSPFSTFDVAGMYDTEDSESRVSLNDDGTATWNMIGSLHWTDFTYIIRGNGIYLDVKEVTADSKPAYLYDCEKKTLTDPDSGTVYYLQDVK